MDAVSIALAMPQQHQWPHRMTMAMCSSDIFIVLLTVSVVQFACRYAGTDAAILKVFPPTLLVDGFQMRVLNHVRCLLGERRSLRRGAFHPTSPSGQFTDVCINSRSDEKFCVRLVLPFQTRRVPIVEAKVAKTLSSK